ncbi:MAG TPA: DUF3180 domain-containing protein [Mycobacteriales bacterium]|jgi:hypothetical protein|nr:DUF3180 domain-containing protein [Mycobacteriales bacterium]
MRPTRPSLLLGTFAVALVVAWVATRFGYDSFPPLPDGPVITVLAVALLECGLAWTTRNRLHRRKRPTSARPIEPMLVARYAVLARASSLAGALIGGAWAGILIDLLSRRSGVEAIDDDRRVAIAGLISGVLLVVAALWLEWVCRIRRPPAQGDEQDKDPGQAA